MENNYIIKTSYFLSLIFLLSCNSDVKSTYQKNESERIISNFSKLISEESPTKKISIDIARMVYEKQMNDKVEGEIVKLLEQVRQNHQMVNLIEELNQKGDKESVLEELFNRWDRIYKSGKWIKREESPNSNYLLHALTPMIHSTDLNPQSTKSIFKAINKRYSKEDKYTIHSQSLITSAVINLNYNELDTGVIELIKEAIFKHNGKASSNGQINVLRKKLGITIYQ